jgi:putative flippase GtrA
VAKGAQATPSRASALTDAASGALRRPANWVQLAKFCAVGSFLVAVTNNYWWNRHWTFRRQRGHLVFQGFRFLVVSTVALAANLAFLSILVALGVPEVPAQAIAIVLVTPWNFVANKLWSFRRRRA